MHISLLVVCIALEDTNKLLSTVPEAPLGPASSNWSFILSASAPWEESYFWLPVVAKPLVTHGMSQRVSRRECGDYSRALNVMVGKVRDCACFC